MNQEAATARAYLNEIVGMNMKSRGINEETGRTETYQTIKKVYEKAVAKGYQEDIATLQRRSQRYAENPESYQDSDVE